MTFGDKITYAGTAALYLWPTHDGWHEIAILADENTCYVRVESIEEMK